MNKILVYISLLLLLCSCKREYCDDFSPEEMAYFPYTKYDTSILYNASIDSQLVFVTTRIGYSKTPVPLLAPGIGCENWYDMDQSVNGIIKQAVINVYKTNDNPFYFYMSYGELTIFENSDAQIVEKLTLKDKSINDVYLYEIPNKENNYNFSKAAFAKGKGLYLIILNDSTYYEKL